MGARRALVFAGLLVTLFLVRIGPAEAATITVTTTADETLANGQTSLREAFAIANGNGQNDVIQLQAGAHYVLDLCAAGPLTHSAVDALTVQGGAGTTLQNTCLESQTIVDTDGTAGLTINALEMTGFPSDDSDFIDGAAIRLEAGGALTLNGVDIHGFSSGGGSIVDGGDFGGSASISDSEIWGNEGTAVTLSFGSMTLTNSEIHDNSGNGIRLIDGTPLTITGSSVNGNGGDGATTTGQGHTEVTISDSELNFNGDLGVGCGACRSVHLTGTTVAGNGQAAGGSGGGGISVTWDIDSLDDAPVLGITNSTIAFNRATRPGGGVSVRFIEDSEPNATPPALNVSGSSISANLTEGALDIDGGGIYADTGNVTISNGSVVNANSAGPRGGATSAEGGGIWHRELANLNGTRTLSVTNSSVSGNEANATGGGIYAAHDGTVSVTGSTLNDNLAGGLSGGAIATAGTATTVTTSRVQGNDADVGGGIAHTSFSGLPVGSLTVARSTLSGNTASFGASGGGGIFVNVGGAGALANVRNSTVTGNTSANFGGGIMVMQTSRLTLNHATVVDNTGATGANVYVAAGDFRTRRAAIALPHGSGNCAFFSAPSVSEGFSWADDTTCNLGTNDVEAPGVDPQLAPLANNGGPTPTRKPSPSTPLDIVPAGSCTIGIDQRGVSRPLGPNCEAGAVEIDETASK